MQIDTFYFDKSVVIVSRIILDRRIIIVSRIILDHRESHEVFSYKKKCMTFFRSHNTVAVSYFSQSISWLDQVNEVRSAQKILCYSWIGEKFFPFSSRFGGLMFPVSYNLLLRKVLFPVPNLSHLKCLLYRTCEICLVFPVSQKSRVLPGESSKISVMVMFL